MSLLKASIADHLEVIVDIRKGNQTKSNPDRYYWQLKYIRDNKLMGMGVGDTKEEALSRAWEMAISKQFILNALLKTEKDNFMNQFQEIGL